MLDEILNTIFKNKNILENLVKVAVVKTYKPETHTAIVEFKDNDNILSDELPILTPFTQNNKAYFPLSENQKVIVLFLPVGENTDGFIVGTIFDEDNPPPVQNRNKFNITFEDGTVIEYDKANNRLFLNVEGQIDIVAKGIINIISDGNVNITVSNGGGNVSVNGNIIATGNIVAAGNISDLNGQHGSLSDLRQTYNSHTHDGDSGGKTSVPNQQVGA